MKTEAFRISVRSFSDNVIFRAFNTTDSEQPLTVTVANNFQKAYLTNLAEERIDELEIKDGKIALNIPKKKIIKVLRREAIIIICLNLFWK